MSEVAGRLAPQMGAWASRSRTAAAASCSAASRASPPAKVVVLGGGIVGYNAAVIALGMQADVLGARQVGRPDARPRDRARRPRHARDVEPRSRSRRSVRDADMVIGAVLIPGARRAEARHARDARPR